MCWSSTLQIMHFLWGVQVSEVNRVHKSTGFRTVPWVLRVKGQSNVRWPPSSQMLHKTLLTNVESLGKRSACAQAYNKDGNARHLNQAVRKIQDLTKELGFWLQLGCPSRHPTSLVPWSCKVISFSLSSEGPQRLHFFFLEVLSSTTAVHLWPSFMW